MISMAKMLKYRNADVPTVMASMSYQGIWLTRWPVFFAGNTRKPRNTIQAMKEVSRCSSSQLVKRVT